MTSEARIARARNLCARIMALAEVGDEVEVIDGFVMRLELGRSYGALDLRRDRRDWDRESDEELADWAVYRALKRTSARQEKADAVAAGMRDDATAPREMSGVVALDLSETE